MPDQTTSVGMARKLAAIFSTDVAGYSRLMGDDEEATIRTLTASREVISSLIQHYRGRVVDSPGDNLLAEFASVVDAVRCAVEIQHTFKEKNAELPEHRRMQFRIGINLGDVIVEGDRLYGDGVNIAARLESLAIPGGICISGTVYDQVKSKLALSYEDLGAQSVKNIAEPVRTYRIGMDAAAAALVEQLALRSFDSAQDRRTQHERKPTPVTPSASLGQALSQSKDSQKRRAGFARRKWTMVAVAGLFLITGAIIAVRYLSLPTPNPQSLPLPDKPSIVVLPFTNLSGDPAQEYFSDGITEDLTTALAKVSALFVIARNSAFTYKGKPVDVKAVSRELGVRYVVEGSVQRADNRVRITAQLLDGSSAAHVWAESYDRELKDIFAMQDEVRQKIVLALKVKLTPEEQERFRRAPTDNLEAYDAFLRGQEYYWPQTKEGNAQARQMWEKALALDPQYAEAGASLGFTYWLEWVWRWSTNPQTLERALALAQQALALDDSLPKAHSLLSFVYVQKQQYEQALAEGERAIALDPNDANSYAMQAEALNYAGRPEEALRMMEQAMRLNPRSPPWYLVNLGVASHLTGRYTESITTLKEVISRSPNHIMAHYLLADSYWLQWVSQQSPAARTLEPAMMSIQRALALNDSLHWNHLGLSRIYLYQQQYEQALAEMERAVALAPNEAYSHARLAEVLSRMGRTEEALEAAAQALRLKPGVADIHLDSVGIAYAVAGRYEEAIAPLKQYFSRYPNHLLVHLTLAAVYSELGQAAEARTEAAEVLRLNPKFSLEVHKQRMPIKDPAVLERHIAALRRAGLK